jgi:hypothetical protein
MFIAVPLGLLPWLRNPKLLCVRVGLPDPLLLCGLCLLCDLLSIESMAAQSISISVSVSVCVSVCLSVPVPMPARDIGGIVGTDAVCDRPSW